jgi:hypothetical protein
LLLNLNTIIKTKNKNHYIIFIYAVVYLYYIFSPLKLVNDLDPSWQFSINNAIANNRNFGSEIIFTYGPLGYLFYGLNEGLLSIHILYKYLYQLLNLFVFLIIIFEIYNYISKIYFNKLLKTLLKYILIPFALLKASIFSDYSLIVFVNIIYAYNLVLKEKSINNVFYKFIVLLFISFGSNVLFFGKISYGIFVLFYALVYIFHQLINKDFKQLVVFSILIFLFFFFILETTSIDLEYYLKNSYEIIIGYKNSMMIDLVTIPRSAYIKYYIFYFLFFLIAIFYFIVIAKNIVGTKYKLISLFIINSASLYYIFSYSFSRGTGTLIFGTPLVIFIFYNFVQSFHSFRIKKIFFYITFIILSVHLTTFLYSYRKSINFSSSKSDLLDKIIIDKKGIINFTNKETFDIYPYLTSIAYYNKLNYKPRPIIQSYSCFTYKLDSINSVFFQKKLVDNIIFHTSPHNITWGGAKLLGNSIDNRYFMFEEPITKIQILNNYENPVNIGDSLFFVQKKINARYLKLDKLNSNTIKFDDISLVQGQELLFATFDFKIKNGTKMLSLIHNLPNVFIEFELNNGKKISHQIVASLLKSPVLINYYCMDYYDFFNIKSNPSSLKKVKNIKFFQSYSGYKEEIIVNFYQAKIIDEIKYCNTSL